MPESFETAWVAAFLVVPGYVFIFFLEAARVRKRREPLLIVLEFAMSLVVWVLAWLLIGAGVLGDADALAQGKIEMRHLVGPIAVLLLVPAMVRQIRKDGGYTGSVEIKNPKDFKAPKVPTGVVQPAPVVAPPPSRTESSRPARS